MCAQLYIQRAAQPDTWVMSGAPAATAIWLSRDTAINYSDATTDTLPANTPAVVYGTLATSVDRTHDVYVPFTVKGSGVLSITKESLLPSLTVDYAPLARVELHGIKPYQPEPYLAAGALGTPISSTTTMASTVGVGKTTELGVSGSPPSGWTGAGFNDSAWSAPIAPTFSYPTPISGAAWVTAVDGTRATDMVIAHRQSFTLPAGAVQSATLTIQPDNYLDALYINDTLFTGLSYSIVYSEFGGQNTPSVVSMPTSLFTAGVSNQLALLYRNAAPQGGANPDAVEFTITVETSSGGAEGDLLFLHSGVWTHLPIGPSGDVLTSDGADPAWAADTGGSGTVTSVGVATPAPLASSGGPITSSGTITLAWASGQTANRVLASPDGTTGAVSLRALVGNDIPVDASTIISSAGTIKGNYQAGSGITISGNTISASGGSGAVTSVALSAPALFSVAGSPVTSSGTLALSYASGQTLPTAQGGTGVDGSAATNGQLLIGNGAGYTLATITAGSGVTVTNGSGTVTIAASGGSGTVTSVALSLPGIFSVSGSPLTTSGTLAVTLANENVATVFAGPASGSAAAPTFRALQGSDLPPAAAAGGHIHAHGHFL